MDSRAPMGQPYIHDWRVLRMQLSPLVWPAGIGSITSSFSPAISITSPGARARRATTTRIVVVDEERGARRPAAPTSNEPEETLLPRSPQGRWMSLGW